MKAQNQVAEAAEKPPEVSEARKPPGSPRSLLFSAPKR